MKRTLSLLAGIALAVAAGCAATAPAARVATPEVREGSPGLVVVFRNASAPSEGVGFRTSRALALREDGTAEELRVIVPDPTAHAGVEDVLWLEGSLPPGAWAGIEVSFASAGTSGPQGRVSLEVPDAPTRVEVPFLVGAGSGTVLAVTLRSPFHPERPDRFEPVFEGVPRTKPTTGLLGLASVGGWNGVALFDKRTGALAAVLPVGPGPAGLAIDPERLRAYVAVAGDDAVVVLDLLEGRVRERIALRAGDSPRDVALAPDGGTLVVANAGSDTVSFVDPLSAIEIERAPVQGRPASLLMDRDGRRVFVLPERASAVSVFSVPSRSVVGSVAVESGPVRARRSGRDGERIVVVHAESPYLTVVDASELTVERRVYVGPGARALEVDPRSGRIFLARSKTGRIEVFDPSSFLPVEEIPVPGEIAWMTVESEGNGLGLLLLEPAEARIVGLVGSGTVARAPLGSRPFSLQFVQGGGTR